MKTKIACLFIVLISVCVQAGDSTQLCDSDAVPEGLAKSDWQSIRAAYEAGRHAFQPVAGGWQARNPGQLWTTQFDGRGFLAGPRDGGWEWGLELQSYGFGSEQRSIGTEGRKAAMHATGTRLTYQWDDAVREWFVNDQRGLEHGFTVQERPALCPADPEAPLSFTLSTRGTLRPCVSADTQGVLFQDAAGATVINYSGLKVWDADGKLLPARFEPLATRHSSLVTLSVEERGARYPLTIDPIAQQAYLKPVFPDASQAGDQFGVSVAISGDTVVVGARFEDSSTTGVNGTPNESAVDAGAAYIFVRNAGVWTQQAYLKPLAVGTTQAGDNFGTSVAIAGNTVVVGAHLEDGSGTGVNIPPNESANGAGAAYVFVRTGTNWSQEAYLKPEAAGSTQAGDIFGFCVAVAGDTVVVGALGEDSNRIGVNSPPNETSSQSGAAYVFARSGTTWTQQAFLKPEAVGTTQAGDQFGTSVAISVDTVVVGAPREDSSTTGVNSAPNESATDAGAAYVFARSGTTWTQQAYLKPAAVFISQAVDLFGQSVAIAGDTVIIGAPGENSGTTGVNSTPNESAPDAGAACLFTRNAGVWTQQAYLKPAAVGTTQQGDSFGFFVSLSGDTAVVGAPNEDSSTTGVNSAPNESATEAGAVYVFVRNSGVWTQQAYLKPDAVGAAQAGDLFGNGVATSGDTVIVGAPGEDSSTTGVNGTPNEDAADSGATCVFERSDTTWTQQAYLKPAGGGTNTAQAGDQFGTSVAVSGDTVVVGAVGEDSSTTGVNSTPNESAPDSGAAYVFTRSGTTWTQQAYLKPAAVGTTQAGDLFGQSVAISDDTLVIGAYFEDSSTTGVNSAPNEGANGSGAAYVFTRSGTAWTQQAYLKPAAGGTTQAGDQFGVSVAVSGDTVVVGAFAEDSSTTGVNSTPNESAADSGAGYVFTRSGTTWTQQAYLKPAAVGSTQAGDEFGVSVAVSGDSVVVGANFEDSSTTGVNSTPDDTIGFNFNAGAAYVFTRSGTAWTQQAYLKPAAVGSTQAGDRFGNSVAISGDTVVVGAFGEDSNTTGVNSSPDEFAADSGAACVFVRSGTTWTQQAYLKPVAVGTTQAGDRFGVSVAVSGDTVVVGAFFEDSISTGVNSTPNEGGANNDSGAAYVFVRTGTTWTQPAYLKPGAVGTTQQRDFFGGSVAVSGDTLVVGAFLEDSSTTGVNSTPNESAADSGAAHVFTIPIPAVTGIAPAGGSTTGGTGVTITGSNFTGAAAVTLGGVAATNVNVVNATSITATTPAHAPGVVDVVVTIPEGTGTGTNLFTYEVPPTLVFVNPPGGSTAGGTTVQIHGINFTGATDVKFAGTSATSFTVDSDTRITATTPAHTPTVPASVTVAKPFTTSSPNGLFTYVNLSNTTDTDGDGLNDAAELHLAGLGFNRLVAQPALVNSFLFSNALFTPAQVQALHMDVPLIQRAPGTGLFTFTFGLQKSTTLAPGSFSPFPFTPAGTSVNAAGKVEFQFTSPDNAAFFRLEPPP